VATIAESGVRVAIYVRRSTDEEHQPFSIEAQDSRLRAYVKSQPGWSLVARFEDDASGAKLDRPGLDKALAAARAGRFDVLLVYRVDRFTRRIRDLVTLLDELDRAGVAFRSATEPFDTSTPAGRMLVQMLGVFAEFEREMIEARTKLDADIKWAYRHYAYLQRTASGLAVQYKAMPDGQSALAGQDLWNDLVKAGRAVASGTLAPEYVGQLIAMGSFGRDLTPKELFALPYSNPTWPMVATVEDLRQALFRLVISNEWMLADSDGDEVRPADPGQIQPASMQQVLRPRPAPVPEPGASPASDPRAAPSGYVAGSDTPTSGSTQTPDPVTPTTSGPGTGSGLSGEVTYEVTKVRMPLSSLMDDSKREGVWGLIRELASIVDPAKRSVDIQMIGLDIAVTAQAGDTGQLVAKAESLPGVTVVVEDEDM
jgi:hypothetical protein